ncbi:GNAT family N-acetyltransferase [Pseudactinotalea suaedae]|jgi:predicted GNAT family acetyltransferase|uniref:GNAT family N-acetyltransferase n=1 Tax=Pseudactinotalea suaedae TaxID=1524924 RepID=UPI001F501163|nr:GNAT family N-acetyltransferase [Pseudactinotalea suaedae]
MIDDDASRLADALTDNRGASVTVAVEAADPVGAYTVAVDGGAPVGRAEYVDPPGAEGERIFFHTEVQSAFGGRGLAKLLVEEALADSIRLGQVVVPLCPLFARHLERHGAEFVAAGGVFRTSTREDIVLVGRLTRHRS